MRTSICRTHCPLPRAEVLKLGCASLVGHKGIAGEAQVKWKTPKNKYKYFQPCQYLRVLRRSFLF